MTAASRTQMSFADLEFMQQGIRLEPVLQHISDFLDRRPELVDRVREDRERGLQKPGSGRGGMTPEQVLRSLALRRIKHWDYRELRERIADGYPLRQFTRCYRRPVPKHDAFHRALQRVSEETLAKVNALVVEAAVDEGREDGRLLRVDTTVVETDIHHPTDNKLWWDTVRVVTRIVGQLKKRLGYSDQQFRTRTRSAKRRSLLIDRATGTQRHQQQVPKYQELIGITRNGLAQARAMLEASRATPAGGSARLVGDVVIEALRTAIEHYCDLGDRVIAQTRRRGLDGEEVPADEKVYSIFEPPTDVIKRGQARPPVEFGHKIFLAERAHGLITPYQVLDGNPADTDPVKRSLELHQDRFGQAPALYAADRGFDSSENVQACQDAGGQLTCIPQRGGKKTPARAAIEKSAAFRRGQRFRAGIEGRISVLFPGRGMKRCYDEGREHFDRFVGATVLANNLLVIGELMLSRQQRAHRRKAA